jgi:hypothetical protein
MLIKDCFMANIFPSLAPLQRMSALVLISVVMLVGLTACGRYAPHPIHTKVTREFYYQTLQQTPADNDDAYYLYYYQHQQQDNPNQPSAIPAPRVAKPMAFRNNPSPTRHPLAAAPLANPPSVLAGTSAKRSNAASAALPAPTIVMVPPQDNDSQYAMPVFPGRNGGSAAVVLVPGGAVEMPYPSDNDELYLPPSGAPTGPNVIQ